MEKETEEKIKVLNKFSNTVMKKLKEMYKFDETIEVTFHQLASLSNADYVHLEIIAKTKHFFMADYRNSKILQKTIQYVRYNEFKGGLVFKFIGKFDKIKELLE